DRRGSDRYREDASVAARRDVWNGWRPPCAGRALVCDSRRRPGSDDSRGRDDVSDESDESVAADASTLRTYAQRVRQPELPVWPGLRLRLGLRLLVESS